MTKKLLITRPEHDLVTRYLSEWFREVIDLAYTKGYQVTDIKQERVNKQLVEKYLQKNNFKTILFNGHGTQNTITGHNNQPLIIEQHNENLLRNADIHALSCQAGKSLGASCIQQGANTFIGYREDFVFLTQKNRECTPSNDNIAKAFKKPAINAPINLIKGTKPKQAYDKAIHAYKQEITEHTSSEETPLAKDIRFWLFWNMSSLTIHNQPPHL